MMLTAASRFLTNTDDFLLLLIMVTFRTLLRHTSLWFQSSDLVFYRTLATELIRPLV